MRASESKFRDFHKLHERFFVLPDAWDVISAVILEHCGYKAIATTSVGLGFALGCPGDTAISKDEMLTMVTAICRAATGGVSVDLESGYADTAGGVEDVVREVIQAGAVAIALEDSDGIPGKVLRPAEEHAERIRAARRAADKEKVPLFINGRTDGFWINDDIPNDIKTREAIRRGNLYRAAGADGVFISGFKAIPADVIEALVRGIDGPFSSLISANGPTIAEFERLGVRRVHLGSLPTRAQYGYLKQALERLRDHGDASLLNQYAIPTREINSLLRSYWQSR